MLYSLSLRGSAVTTAEDIRAVFLLYQAGLLVELRSFLYCSCYPLQKRVSSGDAGVGLSSLGLSCTFARSCARPVNLNVLLHKGMVHSRSVHLACCGGAVSWVSSKFEWYQGRRMASPSFQGGWAASHLLSASY